MNRFVDASFIVALIGKEQGWETLADRLDEEASFLWSGVARWESVIALARSREWSLDQAQDAVNGFAEEYGFTLVAIGQQETEIAIAAARQFGRRSGHPAQLNMGDCFAYACAKAHRAQLLYKGDDFTQTDLA